MDLRDAKAIALQMMDHHGLLNQGWQFVFDNAKTRAGRCDYQARTISLSRNLPGVSGVSGVTDTVLHEIAHALVGPEHGHDATWKAKALEIGCSGERCHAYVLQEAPWQLTCPCGAISAARHKVTWDLLTNRKCRQCQNPLTARNTETGEVRAPTRRLSSRASTVPQGYKYLVTCPCGLVHCPRKVIRRELRETPRNCKACQQPIVILQAS